MPNPHHGPIASYTRVLDPLGNVLQQSASSAPPLFPILVSQTNTYGYDSDNRLTAVDGQTVIHDADGNLIVLGTNTFAYDSESRLIQFSNVGSSGSCTYDGLGNRVARAVAGQSVHFVLDRLTPLTQVLAETDTNGAPIAYYVYGLGLANRITLDGIVATYHFDPLGSTIALTDSAGNITDAYAYDSFGVLANADGYSSQPFRYLGRYGILDDGNGLYHSPARYFSPQLGRFLTKDPVNGTDISSQSLNRYVYALNNPLVRVDASGLFSFDTLGIGVLQALAGYGEGTGGSFVSIYLGAQESLKSGSVFPLLGAGVGAFDTINESSKQVAASFLNIQGSFLNRPPVWADDQPGALDNILKVPGVKQVVEASNIYSLANSVRNIDDIIQNPQDTQRFVNQLKSIATDKGQFAFRIGGAGSLQDAKDLFDFLNSLVSTGGNSLSANTPVIVEILETSNLGPRLGKK